MATKVVTDTDQSDDDLPAPRPTPPRSGGSEKKSRSSGGFFTIYKSGQGYWTRMGTVFGAALIGILSTDFFYHQVPVWLNATNLPANRIRSVNLAICAGFLVAFSLLTFWAMNRPTSADFLIATDSEMKKVNWTSRQELVGSTKIVILFMLIIAVLLFSFDIIFGYIFQFLGVLKTGPFG